MKLREYFLYREENKIFTVKKDKKAYRSTYSVCMFIKATDSSCISHRVTCHSRKKAKEELIRLLRIYTSLTKGEINNL